MTTKNKIEILAPAGGFDSLTAAVRCGADAVYLGAKDFSARASAKNFDFEELKLAIDYCHIRSVKAYLTVNTLMFDKELERAFELVQTAYSYGIDAVIVQDIGFASVLSKHLPLLRLHGSTQMSVHTPSGAKALYELGFKRVVLSRELSLFEIEEIKNSCPIELEVFVHGALCMCVSGQCYFSAMLGGRSGNRGMCAQPCRLPFSLKDGSDYALSLKDNSIIEYIGKLEAIGVTSAKIEGRMKRPEYVAAATKACIEQRDQGFVSDNTARLLSGVFSRTGFTDGYIRGSRTKDMFGYRRKEDVTSADEKLLSEIRGTYKDENPTIPLDFSFTAHLGECPVLTATDGTYTATVTGDTPCENARTLPLARDKVIENLCKCGGTPYYAEHISCTLDQGLSIPLSRINALRRKVLEEISLRRCEITKPESVKYSLSVTSHRVFAAPGLRARFTDTDIPREYLSAELVFVPLITSKEELRRLLSEGFNLGVEVPRGMFSKEEKLRQLLIDAKEAGVSHVLVHNIGAVYMAKELSFTLHGGFGLNITNTESLRWAEDMGLADTELSFELTKVQIEALGGTIPRGIISYGYLPLMMTRCCPGLTSQTGCKNCKSNKYLQDRKGKKFIFTCDGICTEILNSVPLLIPDEINSFSALDFHSFRFSVENSVEKVENTGVFSSKHPFFNEITRGLYYRGVK